MGLRSFVTFSCTQLDQLVCCGLVSVNCGCSTKVRYGPSSEEYYAYRFSSTFPTYSDS